MADDLQTQLSDLEKRTREINIQPTSQKNMDEFGPTWDPSAEGISNTSTPKAMPSLSDGPVVDQTVTGTPTNETVKEQPVSQSVDPASLEGQLSSLADRTAKLDAAPQETLPQQTQYNQEYQDVNKISQGIAGFNRQFAYVLGVPPEAANELLNFIGLGLWDPYMGKAPQYIAERMKEMGIAVDLAEPAARTFASRVGSETFKNVATTAALLNAAPRMMQAGKDIGSNVLEKIGEMFKANPKLSLFLTPFESAGAVVGEDIGGVPGAVVGGVAGGMVGGGTAAIGRKAGRGIVSATESVMNTVTGKPFKTPGPALRDPTAEPQYTHTFAENQVEAEKMQMATALKDAVDSIPRTGTSQQVQTRTRELMDKAEKTAARIESTFWDRVPQTTQVPVSQLRKDATALQKELSDTPSQAPTEFLERLKELSSPKRDPDTGRMMKALPTVKRLRDFRAEVRLARKREEGLENQGITPNYGLVRNYNKVENLIDDAIEAALPGDVTIPQARRVSTIYHDLFSRGGVADVLARRARGDNSIPPGTTVEELMSRFGGIEELLAIRDKLVYVRKPGGAGFAVSPDERKNLQGMVTEAENSVRAMFRQYADENGIENAPKFIDKHNTTIKALGKVHAELTQVGEEIKAVMAQEKVFRNSALNRYIASDSEKAIDKVWTGPNPAKTAKELVSTFQKDPDAIGGFKAGIIDRFLKTVKNDPNKARDLLFSSRYGDLMRNTLDPSEYSRLQKIVEVTYRIHGGDEKILRHSMLPGATIMARLIGASVGRQMSHITGGSGTLQGPSIMSNAFKQSIEKVFRSTDPGEMLTNAVLDPKWERLLLTREPTTTHQARRLMIQMRRTAGAIEGLRQGMLGNGDKEE